ncbi:alkyl sulfatase C-terminal domain-containing protein [Geodermatophilus sp. URMC 64]
MHGTDGPFGEEEAGVATMDQCLKALDEILGSLAANPAAEGLDRSLSCRLTDLGQTVRGQLRSGAVADLHVLPADEPQPKADIRFTMSSDDLVALTDGRLSFGPAWASGRVKLEAGFRDLLRLRKLL